MLADRSVSLSRWFNQLAENHWKSRPRKAKLLSWCGVVRVANIVAWAKSWSGTALSAMWPFWMRTCYLPRKKNDDIRPWVWHGSWFGGWSIYESGLDHMTFVTFVSSRFLVPWSFIILLSRPLGMQRYFFDDKEDNIRPFASTNYNAMQVSCASRPWAEEGCGIEIWKASNGWNKSKQVKHSLYLIYHLFQAW